MGRIGIVFGLGAVVAVGACALWPERWAVNAPLTNSLFGLERDLPEASALARRVHVPDGFSISVWATGLKNARMLRFTAAGDLLVSQPRLGQITLVERDAAATPDGRRVLLSDLNRPHGMDFHEGWLYVAETDAIGRIRFDPASRSVSGGFERVVTGLPGGGNHWTRTLAFGPDGWMYVTIGSDCNVCEEKDERRSAMLRFRPDGSDGEIFARGLRNSVGFDWQPGTGVLYATDNGRDLLGDDFPPCELNRIEANKHYGWPYAHGAKVPDPEFGPGNPSKVSASVAPTHGFGAHTAPLGMTFLRGAHWPPAYRGAALVALHGSWNRTRKQGYEVVSLHFGERGNVTERRFAWGFEEDGDVIGRPVDVAEGPDGAAYITDDYTGSVYRVASGTGDAAGDAPSGATGAIADPLAGLPQAEREARSARGKALYTRWFCAQCHEGVRAAEGVVVVKLQNLGARYGVEDLIAFLEAPTPPMPALDLPEQDRRDLAVYLLDAHP
jgi:glucose/arabinose dehydrogenase